MKYSLLFLILFLSSGQLSQAASDVVHHPTPKKPLYLEESLYTDLKSKIPAPPVAGSSGQKRDEEILLKYQIDRAQSQCTQAQVEVMVNLKNFYTGILSEKEIARLTLFFEQVRNDGDFFIQKMKKDFPRKRPFLYMKNLTPCVPKEVTGAYPSGHATLSKMYSLILSDLYPEKAKKFSERAVEIGNNRVLSGMHHTSDIEAGQTLGTEIYTALKKAKKFQMDLSSLKN